MDKRALIMIQPNGTEIEVPTKTRDYIDGKFVVNEDFLKCCKICGKSIEELEYIMTNEFDAFEDEQQKQEVYICNEDRYRLVIRGHGFYEK